MMKTHILVSGYSTKDLPSIKLYEINKDGIKCLWSDDIESPTFLVTHNNLMFAVTETEGQSEFYMYKVDGDGYKLLNHCSVQIGGICHILYLEKEKLLVASSYGEGILFTLKVEKESFGPIANKYKYGVDGIKSRIHCTLANEKETKIYGIDLGLDRLYEFELVDGEMKESGYLQLPLGSGPRHLCFGKDERYIYIVTEYSNEIFLVDINGKHMKHLKTYLNRIISEENEHLGASICVSQDKRFLYTSTRGQNCINVHEIYNDFELKEVQNISTSGIWPRHIALINKDEYLIVANQLSNTITFFSRSRKNGSLQFTDMRTDFEQVSFVKEV